MKNSAAKEIQYKFRILITGDPAAGKSTAAVNLGKYLGVPVFHADRELFREFNLKFSPQECERKMNDFIKNDGYIIEGLNLCDDENFFYKLLADADVILNFETSPQTSINTYFKKVTDMEMGIETLGLPEGLRLKNTEENAKAWLRYYCDYLDNKAKLKKQLLQFAPKVIKIKDYSAADKLITNFKSGQILKDANGVKFLFDPNSL